MEMQHIAHMQQQAAAREHKEKLGAFLLLLATVNSSGCRATTPATFSETVEHSGA